MSMRQALERSKNMVSIRILQSVGAPYAQNWITRFGFDADKHPAYLPMALGTGSVTPMQMASAYGVFANGGYRVNPTLISRITDQRGRVLHETKPVALDESMRTLDARNAFVMDSLLQSVALRGTAAAARRALNRPDLYGKTGTTNESVDTWFAGFQPGLVAVVWIGYDTPRKLGDNETGGGLSLPIWIEFMKHALNGVPVEQYPVPDGVVNVADEWFYEEFTKGAGVTSLGLEDKLPTPANEDERKGILDLFRR
jgi:penicillin-binding protein 1A